MPEVIVDYPPLFDEIDKAFNVRGKTVIYAWGNRIYNPNNAILAPELLAHEAAHGQRQGTDIIGWWHRYIEDIAFRRDEEIFAHVAEYRWLLANANRPERRQALKRVALRLANPLYGPLISAAQARKVLSSAGKP